MAADVIVRDQHGRLLLVNPNYKPDWDLPGGMVEANEPPIEGAARELREELGLTVQIGPLLAVDWIEPHGPWDDTLVFVFDGGTLSADQVAALRITDDELSGFRFCARDEAARLLRPYVCNAPPPRSTRCPAAERCTSTALPPPPSLTSRDRRRRFNQQR